MFSQSIHWRNYVKASPQILALEKKLIPSPYSLRIIEHKGNLASTANTDVKLGVINLDIMQPPLKTALSYAYELKNFENRHALLKLVQRAENKQISKTEYIKRTLSLEAEAVYFRCSVFRELKLNDEEFPNKKIYLQLYDSFAHLDKSESIKQFQIFITENGIVRNKFSAKKYYADAYDSYTNKKRWPEEYDQIEPKKPISPIYPSYRSF